MNGDQRVTLREQVIRLVFIFAPSLGIGRLWPMAPNHLVFFFRKIGSSTANIHAY